MQATPLLNPRMKPSSIISRTDYLLSGVQSIVVFSIKLSAITVS
jgi:hypothetical protein